MSRLLSPEILSLAARLELVTLVDPERDLIERLDLLEVVAGTLRYAGTSSPSERDARRLVRRLAHATGGRLTHGLRSVGDDRADRLRERGGLPPFVVSAFERRPSPLPMAFAWRPDDVPPPRAIARLDLGPLLGYPPCCVIFEEARRADLVEAEARGMLETWGASDTRDLLAGIDLRRPFLVDERVADDEGRVRRLRRCPFASFVPCPDCARLGARSPAGRVNARRRQLARALSPRLVQAIESVRG